MNYLLNTSTDPYFNMAFDSYVLENTDFEGVYLWQNAPSVILGLNQSIYAEVNLPYLRAHGILPVRRVSGGGAVYHDLGNVNYTFVGSGPWVASGPSVIAAALRSMGVPADVTGRNDILVDGRKCSGYAKRYASGAPHRMMVHGTLMYDVDLEALTQALAVPEASFPLQVWSLCACVLPTCGSTCLTVLCRNSLRQYWSFVQDRGLLAHSRRNNCRKWRR